MFSLFFDALGGSLVEAVDDADGLAAPSGVLDFFLAIATSLQF